MSRSLPSKKIKHALQERLSPVSHHLPSNLHSTYFSIHAHSKPKEPFIPSRSAKCLTIGDLCQEPEESVGEENPTSACSPACYKAHHKKDLERSEGVWTWAWPYQEKEKLGLGDARWKAGQGSPASERTAGRGFPSRLLVFLSIYKCSLYTKVQPCLGTMSAMVGIRIPCLTAISIKRRRD